MLLQSLNRAVRTSTTTSLSRTMSSQAGIPKTMKAIQVGRLSPFGLLWCWTDLMLMEQISKTGGPEVIELNEVPVPTPKANEVLIKVQWT